jgi:hypothetical protein
MDIGVDLNPYIMIRVGTMRVFSNEFSYVTQKYEFNLLEAFRSLH